MVGAIIGRGGQTIRQITQQTRFVYLQTSGYDVTNFLWPKLAEIGIFVVRGFDIVKIIWSKQEVIEINRNKQKGKGLMRVWSQQMFCYSSRIPKNTYICYRARVDVHRKDNVGSVEKAITIYGQPENCTNACQQVNNLIQFSKVWNPCTVIQQVVLSLGCLSENNIIILKMCWTYFRWNEVSKF